MAQSFAAMEQLANGALEKLAGFGWAPANLPSEEVVKAAGRSALSTRG